MLNITEFQDRLTSDLADLAWEVDTVYNTLVLPRWDTDLRHYPMTLYGYLMDCFAWLDVVSRCWRGTNDTQTSRMVGFLDHYVSPNREANNVAVQLWRHTLMHTSQPRKLFDRRTGVTYHWLLHWSDQLPRLQHYTFAIRSSTERILNIALLYLLSDFQRGLTNYLADLAVDLQLQQNCLQAWPAVEVQGFTSRP